jgi:hypothetical protein
MDNIFILKVKNNSAVASFIEEDKWEWLESFYGRRVGSNWIMPDVKLDRKKPKHFIYFCGFLMCDEYVYMSVAHILEKDVEFLPVKSESGEVYYFLNIIGVRDDVLNYEKSVFVRYDGRVEILAAECKDLWLWILSCCRSGCLTA